jgi:cyanophycin synthetase
VRFIDLRHLSGPNVFTASPVAIARLELDELTCKETTDFGGFAERLTELLPGLATHHCATGAPGGFLAAMTQGTYFGHVTEHVMLELSGLAGRPAYLGRTTWAGADGRYDVMTECPEDEPASSVVPTELLRLAMRIVQELLSDGDATPGFQSDLEQIASICERERLGVSTAAIAAAARQRGIPARRVAGLSLLRLGYGRHRQLVCAALTSQTSAVGVDIAADKQLTKQLLAGAGIPVAEGVTAWSPLEAAAALVEIGGPVVIKPLVGSQGANLTVGVRTAAEAATAYSKAATVSEAVLVEALVPGTDYRVLVIDGQIAAAAQLRPASVTGDGLHTIGQLVATANTDPRRGVGHSRELTMIKLDADALSHLDALGLDDHSVPAAGQVVTLRRNANLSTGGTSKDVTDLIHPEVAEICRRAAALSGIDVCGIDLRLGDITAPLHDPSGHGAAQPCAVLELNACPGLRMHLSPTEGRPRDVAAAVVDSLYPPGAPARIPVISVTGTNGKTTTVRMIGQVLQQAGMRTGMTCTDGVYVGGRLVYAADASGPKSAEMVLDDPTVEAAVLETARGGIVRRGLGYDSADIAIVTNIAADHLGDDCIDDLDELIHVKALVAEEICDGGSVVLNADDPATAALADRPAVRAHAPVIRLFSVMPGNAVLARHKAAGGACYEVIDGQLTETQAGEQRSMLAVADLPGAFSGRATHVVANALAAVAACRAAGISVKDIARGLAAFVPADHNPGRASVFRVGTSPVIVDYGHNAAALEATGRLVRDVWSGQPVAAVTLPGDRRDDLLVATAEAIARWFPAVVLYEDSDKRGRETGEMLTLIGSALRAARPGIVCRPAENPADALRAALELAGGAPVLFVYEKLALATDALAAVGAEPWPDERRPDTAGTSRQPTIMGTGPTDAADAAQAAVASATAVVAGAAEAAEAAVADAAAVVADAAAAAITDAADAALVRPRVPAPATRSPRPAPAAARNSTGREPAAARNSAGRDASARAASNAAVSDSAPATASNAADSDSAPAAAGSSAGRDGIPPATRNAGGGRDAPAGDASADYGR